MKLEISSMLQGVSYSLSDRFVHIIKADWTTRLVSRPCPVMQTDGQNNLLKLLRFKKTIIKKATPENRHGYSIMFQRNILFNPNFGLINWSRGEGRYRGGGGAREKFSCQEVSGFFRCMHGIRTQGWGGDLSPLTTPEQRLSSLERVK